MTQPGHTWTQDELDEERATAPGRGGTLRASVRKRPIVWALSTLGVLAGIGMAVVWGWSATRGVLFTNTGFEIVDDTHATVRFDVNRDPGREVVCVLRAQDIDHQAAGRNEVVVPAAQEHVTRETFELRTTHRAVTAFVDSCRYR